MLLADCPPWPVNLQIGRWCHHTPGIQVSLELWCMHCNNTGAWFSKICLWNINASYRKKSLGPRCILQQQALQEHIFNNTIVFVKQECPWQQQSPNWLYLVWRSQSRSQGHWLSLQSAHWYTNLLIFFYLPSLRLFQGWYLSKSQCKILCFFQSESEHVPILISLNSYSHSLGQRAYWPFLRLKCSLQLWHFM